MTVWDVSTRNVNCVSVEDRVCYLKLYSPEVIARDRSIDDFAQPFEINVDQR